MKTMGNVFVSETPHAQSFPSLVSQIDRLLHTLNEAHPVPLQVIKSGLDIVSFILSECKSYSLFASCFSLSASITEITGILAEVYLLTSICLPATSLLLRPSLTFGVTPADKLLLNVAYLQLFTFPLLAWGDIRSAFAAVLRCAAASPALRIAPAVPARVAAAFSVLYFIYDNSVLNVTPDAESLCDRTATPSAATRISEGFRLKDGAVAMGVNPEHLRDPQYKNDHRLTQLLCRAYDEHFTSRPPCPLRARLTRSFNVDSPRYDALLVECYRAECYDVPVLQSVPSSPCSHA